MWCLANSWCFAARDFGLPLGASDEHTRQWSVRSEQRRGRPKELLPQGLRRKWPGASLLLSHRSLRICSFVAPRPRPFWAQRHTSYLRDTTLGHAEPSAIPSAESNATISFSHLFHIHSLGVFCFGNSSLVAKPKDTSSSDRIGNSTADCPLPTVGMLGRCMVIGVFFENWSRTPCR